MRKNQRGFTLLEIFISLAIGLVLIGGILSVFVGVKTTTTETLSMGELQENGRFAVSILTDDLLRQNFWGDLSGNLSRSVITDIPANPGADCVGEGANNGSFPQASGSFRTLWAQEVKSNNMLGCITNAELNSDILQIKRAVTLPINPIAPATVVTNVQLLDTRYYIQSNSSNANVFQGNITPPTLVESRIWEYQHHIYYVRNDTVPVLVQGRLQAGDNAISFNMLVEGIEKVHYMFGVDTDGDGIINAYIPSKDMADSWDNVNNIRILAVKLYVLVRSIRQDPKYTNDNIYTMGDIEFDADGDNFRRLLFSSTVSLHNARVATW